MSNLFDFAPLLSQGSSIRRAQVIGFSDEGLVQALPQGAERPLDCQVLNPDTSNAILSHGDEVLVWCTDARPAGEVSAVILGRVGSHLGPPQTVVDADEFAARPKERIIEAQGDLILRNGQSRIKLGAQGDVEIVCTSFVTRSQRLLRLLAPFIKLN